MKIVNDRREWVILMLNHLPKNSPEWEELKSEYWEKHHNKSLLIPSLLIDEHPLPAPMGQLFYLDFQYSNTKL